MFSLNRLINSFKDALRGLKFVFNNEQNFRLQLIVAILILGCIAYFPLRTWETVLLLLLIASVLVMELLNTAIERFADLLKPRLHYYVGTVKDIMAAGVLVSSAGALIIGLIIMLPHFLNLLK